MACSANWVHRLPLLIRRLFRLEISYRLSDCGGCRWVYWFFCSFGGDRHDSCDTPTPPPGASNITLANSKHLVKRPTHLAMDVLRLVGFDCCGLAEAALAMDSTHSGKELAADDWPNR